MILAQLHHYKCLLTSSKHLSLTGAFFSFQMNQSFDLHLYVTSEPSFASKPLYLIQDPSVPDRVIPSATKHPCDPTLKESNYHVLSFRSQYLPSPDRMWTFGKPAICINSISTCDYRQSNFAQRKDHLITPQQTAQFVLPEALAR